MSKERPAKKSFANHKSNSYKTKDIKPSFSKGKSSFKAKGDFKDKSTFKGKSDFKEKAKFRTKSDSDRDFRKSKSASFGKSKFKKGVGVYSKHASDRATFGNHRDRDRVNKSNAKPKFILQTNSVESEKLQKVLANQGLGSRRTMEEKIKLGQVKVNGEVANLGTRVTSKDVIIVDDKPLKKQLQARRVLVYNKPEGELVTRYDEEGRDIVFSHLPHLPIGRWIPVGRLDINTSGLLLFTNDGELADILAHPSSGMVREYMVRVLGEVTTEDLEKLKTGIELEDGMAHFDSIEPLKVKLNDDAETQVANSWFKVTTTEGRNRIVRRLWEAAGFSVSRLKRISFAGVNLNREDKLGKWREVSVFYIEKLSKSLNLTTIYADEHQAQELAKLMRMDKKLVNYSTKNQVRDRKNFSKKNFGEGKENRFSNSKSFADKSHKFANNRKKSKESALPKIQLGKNRPPRKEKLLYKNPKLQK